MYLSQLLYYSPWKLLGRDVQVSGMTYDSRRVRDGWLFIAVKGFNVDGHRFIDDAIKRGAAAVMVETPATGLSIPQLVTDDTRRAMAEASARYYGHPSRKLRVIAVTGTNGKTTTTYLIKKGLEETGYAVGLAGTVQRMIGQTVYETGRTTPESIDLQAFMAELVALGTDYFVFEASSHGMVLRRLDYMDIDVAVYTNLSQDHLDFHPTMEDYAAAKAMLFASLGSTGSLKNKAAVINMDDAFGQTMRSQCRVRPITYGLNSDCDVTARNVVLSEMGLRYELHSPVGPMNVSLPLSGKFNVYNSLAAAAVFCQEGFSARQIDHAMHALEPVPGRFEPVQVQQPFGVVVDYAHTPDSLDNVLSTARGSATGQIISVFGAGGDRDAAKRPLMAKAASKYSDYIIITSDNPRSEDPAAICRQIEKGLRDVGFGDYHVEVDRRRAIRQGIGMARAGDMVVIAGKGHETYQEIDGRTLHFDDREEALAVLKELAANETNNP